MSRGLKGEGPGALHRAGEVLSGRGSCRSRPGELRGGGASLELSTERVKGPTQDSCFFSDTFGKVVDGFESRGDRI